MGDFYKKHGWDLKYNFFTDPTQKKRNEISNNSLINEVADGKHFDNEDDLNNAVDELWKQDSYRQINPNQNNPISGFQNSKFNKTANSMDLYGIGDQLVNSFNVYKDDDIYEKNGLSNDSGREHSIGAIFNAIGRKENVNNLYGQEVGRLNLGQQAFNSNGDVANGWNNMNLSDYNKYSSEYANGNQLNWKNFAANNQAAASGFINGMKYSNGNLFAGIVSGVAAGLGDLSDQLIFRKKSAKRMENVVNDARQTAYANNYSNLSNATNNFYNKKYSNDQIQAAFGGRINRFERGSSVINGNWDKKDLLYLKMANNAIDRMGSGFENYSDEKKMALAKALVITAKSESGLDPKSRVVTRDKEDPSKIIAETHGLFQWIKSRREAILEELNNNGKDYSFISDIDPETQMYMYMREGINKGVMKALMDGDYDERQMAMAIKHNGLLPGEFQKWNGNVESGMDHVKNRMKNVKGSDRSDEYNSGLKLMNEYINRYYDENTKSNYDPSLDFMDYDKIDLILDEDNNKGKTIKKSNNIFDENGRFIKNKGAFGEGKIVHLGDSDKYEVPVELKDRMTEVDKKYIDFKNNEKIEKEETNSVINKYIKYIENSK